MDFKRILRTPMLWIVVLIGAAILVLSLSDNGGFTRIDTSKALDLINTSKVDSAKLINNERMELTLKQGESFSTATRSRTPPRCTRTTSRPEARTWSPRSTATSLPNG